MANINLEIDQTELKTAIEAYAQAASDMSTLTSEVTSAVETLRANWKSEAGDAFFKELDDVWKKSMEDYTKVVAHLGESLSVADGKYQTLYDEADKLTLGESVE